MTITSPEKIANHYTMIKKIGAGAMGDVFLATDDRLEREVALKLLKILGDTPEEKQQYVQRFQQEARTIARLHHPNIVSLFDIGFEFGQFYMVMEYVNGRNLQEMMDSTDRQMKSQVVIQLAVQLCQALKAAHDQGIIHRDVKPANILISVKNELKLTDFGIARINEAQDMRLTQAGTMLGSFLYAAPEQLTNAADVDHRADIYGMAATLYELLTRQPVHNAAHVGQLIQMIFTQEPKAPHLLNPQVPEALSAILLKALQKHPTQRYSTVDEMLKDLLLLQGQEQPQIQPGELPLAERTESFKDTRTSQLRLSLLKTTQSGIGQVLKHLRADQVWLNLLLQQYQALPSQLSYAEILPRLKQPDLEGKCFSGVIALQDTWVFIRRGQICAALNSSESLINDAALERLPRTSPVLFTYALPETFIKTLAAFVANTSTPIQENLDSALVNLYPMVADLTSETEAFSGYTVCRFFSEDSLSQDAQTPTETHIFLYDHGQQMFSFALNNSHQLLETGQDIRQVLDKGRCLLSIYMPRQELLNTVIRDFWSLTQLKVDYKDPDEGTLQDMALLAPGEISHCLTEAVGPNLHFAFQATSGEVLPEPVVEKLRESPEYRAAHWILSEFFFSLNATQQVNAFKALYPRLPQIEVLHCKENLGAHFGLDVTYDLVAYSAGRVVFVVRLGDGDPVDIELFCEETVLLKKQLQQQSQDALHGAFYLSHKPLNNQASALFASQTQKVGLLNKQKGWVKVNKEGFHLLLAEISDKQLPRLIAPNLLG